MFVIVSIIVNTCFFVNELYYYINNSFFLFIALEVTRRKDMTVYSYNRNYY